MIPILTTLSVITSWYGPGFQGRLTANGERYNQNGLTAAHKTLPFGTRLKVCFRRCAVVRVNDRGPYAHGRDIDLSRGAADAIGLTNSGVGRVKLTRLT
jgi:rare lipoprotein A